MHLVGPSEKAVDIPSSSACKKTPPKSKLLEEKIKALRANPDLCPDMLAFFTDLLIKDLAESTDDEVPEADEVPPQNNANGSEALVFRGKRMLLSAMTFVFCRIQL